VPGVTAVASGVVVRLALLLKHKKGGQMPALFSLGNSRGFGPGVGYNSIARWWTIALRLRRKRGDTQRAQVKRRAEGIRPWRA